jgi:hypothetical protein
MKNDTSYPASFFGAVLGTQFGIELGQAVWCIVKYGNDPLPLYNPYIQLPFTLAGMTLGAYYGNELYHDIKDWAEPTDHMAVTGGLPAVEL